jgi:hypothetical protein
MAGVFFLIKLFFCYNKNMAVITKKTKNKIISNFEIMGEKFVVLKKEYLDELLILLKSVFVGEKLLKEKKTRSFDEFLRSLSKK